MKVGMKLAASSGALIGLIILLAVIHAVSEARVADSVVQLYERGVRGTQALGVARAKLQRMRALGYLHAATDEEVDDVEQQIAELEEELLAALQEYETLLQGDTARAALLEEVRADYARYARLRQEQVFPLGRADEADEALELMSRVTGPVFESTLQTLDRLVDDHVAVSAGVYEQALDTLADTRRVSSALSVVVTLLAALVAWLLSRSISSRLREVAAAARRAGRGALGARVDVVGNDEIAEVALALNQLTTSLAAKLEEEKEAARRQAEERGRLAETVSRYAAFVRRVARGELSAQLESTGEGELRELGENLGAMGEALRTMTLRIHEAVGALSATTAQIMSTVQEHATSANESAAAVTETAATVDEVQQSAQRVTEQAGHVADVSRRSVEVSDAGRQAVEHTVVTMSDVRDQVDGIAKRILSLSEQSQAVGQIITSVNELAEQSNLLALNAAIEAARAGSAGRGFAVVAQEIRALADQSKEATGHVRGMLGDIQQSTTEAVLATEQGSKAVTRGMEAVQGAGERIEQLAGTISEASRAADHILTAAQQQAQGVDQISQAMHSIDEASRQTVEGTRSLESAAHNLNQLAAHLRDATAQYRA